MDRGVTSAAEGWRFTLTNLGRTKPRGPGAAYGERAVALGAATMIDGVRGREGCAHWRLFIETTDAEGAGSRWSPATSAASDDRGQSPLVRCLHENRLRIDLVDGRFIMPPSPEAAPVIAASALA